jgi:hypothetical protein
VAITIGLVISGSTAQAKVDPPDRGPQRSVLSEDAMAKITGGGTVYAKPADPTTVASFGVNARRPAGFVSGGAAEGRINYDRHIDKADRHVNVPVTYMQAAPNQPGGDALLLGDCAGATCPSGIGFVFVYLKDAEDRAQDVFDIYFCSGPPSPPSGFVPGGSIVGCDAPEGGTLRSGNIQVRGEDH